MSRTPTASVTSKMSQALGTEPMVIVKIDWESGSVYYADKTITVGAITASGRLLSCSEINTAQTSDSKGQISGASLSLSDNDGGLKTIWNCDIIEKTLVTIYHHFVGLGQADLLEVFKGHIINPVRWDEGTATLSFEVESIINAELVGYAPEEGDIENLAPTAVDKPWPLCFGTVIHVPCVKVRSYLEGTLREGITHNTTSFYVDGGRDFPQNTEIEIRIGNIKFTGHFEDDTFYVTSSNDVINTNVEIASRPTDDPDYNNAAVVWLKNDENLVKQYCIVEDPQYGWMCNRCIGQVGKKAYFTKPWRPNNTQLGICLNSTHTIEETAGVPRPDWEVTFVFESYSWYVDNSWTPEDGYVLGTIMIAGTFGLYAGYVVRMWAEYNELYVANLIPSFEILDVYAYRIDVNGERIFAPIPSSYYTKKLSDSLAGKSPTTIELVQPLGWYVDEKWEDAIYVSLRSSRGNNAADIIKYITETYTTLSVDSTSHLAVRSKVATYVANFAIFTLMDAMQLCEDIAWQSRMAILLRNETVYFKYLSEVPTADKAVTEDETELKTLQLGFVNTEDLVTKVTATWYKDYSGRSASKKEIVYNPGNDFKTNEKEIDLYIYNIEDLAKLSLYWWGYRWSNSWRTADLKCFLEGLALESFDVVAHSIDKLSLNTIKGQVKTVGHNSDDNSISLSSILASKAGQVDSVYQPVEDEQFWKGDPNFDIDNPLTIPDPGAGRKEIDYSIPDYYSGDSDDDGEDKYKLVITECPNEIQRDVDTAIRIEIHNEKGEIIRESPTAILHLDSTDGSDALSTTSIQFVAGVWYSTSLQITGGSGADDGSITVASENYESDTAEFTIVDELGTLSWDVYPTSVTRNSTFSVGLSGGTPGGTLEIGLNSSDIKDKIYNAAGRVTSITLDGYGEYSASDWYITGGTSAATGSLVAHDPNRQFADAATPAFPITGLAEQIIRDLISLEDYLTGSENPDQLVITVPDFIVDDTAFALTVEYQDSTGEVITDYTGPINLVLRDNDGEPITWLDGGPDAAIYGNTLIVNATNGVWTFASCKVSIDDETSPAWFQAELNDILANESCPIGAPYLSVTLPDTIYRGVPFNVVLQAKNADGSDKTDYTPQSYVSFALTSSDASDEITPESTDSTSWSSGAKTVECSISGGTGADAITLICTDADLTYITGQDTASVADAFSTWSSGGTLASAISKLIYASADDKFYAKCADGKVYRYDGGTTWTDLGAAAGDICAYGGYMFRGNVTGGNIYAYKWNGSSWTQEYTLFAAGLAAYLTAGSDGNLYLSDAYYATIEKTARRSGGSWTTLGTGPGYGDGAVAYVNALTEIFDGALRYTDTYVAGTTVGAAPTFLVNTVVVGSRLYGANGASGFLYVTSKDGATSTLALPSGYNYADMCYSAGNKLYALLRKTSDSSWHIMSYDGSNWTNERDVTYAASSRYAKSATAMMVIINTTVLVKS